MFAFEGSDLTLSNAKTTAGKTNIKGSFTSDNKYIASTLQETES